jgi:REP element-mobilizing transposase RayT
MASLPLNPQNQMILSKIGQIVQTEWLNTPQIRMDMNLSLGEFIIMPNHFHAILIIGKNEYNKQPLSELSLETPGMASLRFQLPQSKQGPQCKNVSSIIRGFKSAVTIKARLINPYFEWQSRFYDHVIRNYPEFDRIQQYIINNPNSWNIDKFYK